MRPNHNLLIFGASTRAAAQSALRAGFHPRCADLFADKDAENLWPVELVPLDRYPQAFAEIARSQPPGPWMYTGAIENHPALVAEISSGHALWGNDPQALARARSPDFVASLLQQARLPCPALASPSGKARSSVRWLAKPYQSAGGTGIRFADAAESGSTGQVYLQEHIPGDARSAVYIGNGNRAQLLGATKQLVGEVWLHALPFHYCGSIGPISLDSDRQDAFARLGTTIAAGCGLRGLFGIDCIVRDGTVWPVEINPRYTASVEVLELASGVSAISLHAGVFDQAMDPVQRQVPEASVVGKAILFARKSLTFPGLAALSKSCGNAGVPLPRDIPRGGEMIKGGWPILTLFAYASSVEDCWESLQRQAATLDRALFDP